MMLKTEIRVGMFVKAGSHVYGKAQILTEPEPLYEGSRRFSVEIEYPDAPPTVPEFRKNRQRIEIRKIDREWNAEDERLFKQHWKTVETERGWNQALAEAGYPGTVLYYDNEDKFHVTFEGLVAERVLEVLTGEHIPKKEEAEEAD